MFYKDSMQEEALNLKKFKNWTRMSQKKDSRRNEK